MKTIFKFLIVSLIAVILISATQNPSGKARSIILQAENKNVSTQLLYKSSDIISTRLKAYGLTSPEVSVIAGKGQIKVQLPDNIKLQEIEGLLLSRGELAFYETLSLEGLTAYLKNDPRISQHDSKIGCTATEDRDLVSRVNEFLKSKNLSAECRLAWGFKNDKSLYCLYALKINQTGKPLLTRSDIETIKASADKNSQSSLINIKFNVLSARVWEKATKENLNKSIAIVLDNKVFYDPVVKSTITDGLCEISGNMTQNEVNYFLALVNNDQLPVNFSLVK
jgi:SecD/SecF fusion protein